MKLNENFSNKNDLNYLNKFDFSKNDSFGLPIQNKNSKNKNTKEHYNIINHLNIDPRLELTLKYLDINSTMPTFITNNISFNDLLLLSKNDLMELGFSLVERNRILHFSQEFKNFGKKYNIKEINNFFNEFQNLNIRLVTINNNIQSFPSPNEKEMNNIDIFNNINNQSLNNNENCNYSNNDIKTKNNNYLPNTNSYNLEDKFYNNSQNNFTNNDFYPKSNIFSNTNKKTSEIGNKKYNDNNLKNNDNKLFNHFLSPNKINNKNKIPEQQYQESINNNLNHNSSSNYQEADTSKLIRQNSKTSKNSSYSKNNKSRLVTMSKNFLPSSSASESIIQKYQNLSEEIDNYFKKYNNSKENKKCKMKNQFITSSNHSKKNYNPIFINNKNYINKKTNTSNLNNISNINNVNENDIDDKRNNEISQKLKELQKKKKELKEKLNTVCDKENKKKIIIKYLEEEEEEDKY